MAIEPEGEIPDKFGSHGGPGVATELTFVYSPCLAADARVSESVMMTNYVKESDEEARQRSNRTYRRILASLSPEVAVRYGYIHDARSEMESHLRAAIDDKNWGRVSELVAKLGQESPDRSK